MEDGNACLSWPRVVNAREFPALLGHLLWRCVPLYEHVSEGLIVVELKDLVAMLGMGISPVVPLVVPQIVALTASLVA